MGKDSGIQWCHHTFNGWRGCVECSTGCLHCYARELAKRNPAVLGVWGKDGTRVLASESMWQSPLKWDSEARSMGERHRVFAFSLADVFEDWSGKIVGSNGHAVYKGSLGGWMRSTGSPPSKSSLLRMDDARARLFGLIAATPRLDWLVLTKRPEAMSRFFKAKSNAWEAADYYRDYIYGRDSDVSLGDGLKDWPPRNLWAVTSVENQAAKSRIDELRNVESTVRFLSVEPLVEDLGELDLRGIDWVIVGGESGSKARPFDLAWARSIRDQCRRVGVAFFMKQIGSYPVVNYYDVILRDHYDRSGWDWPDPIDWSIEFDGQPRPTARVRLKTKDSHGGDWLEWGDEFLKVREFPGSKVR